LAGGAAAVVCVIADGTFGKFAGSCVAAPVVAAAFGAAAVAVFAFFNNAVAALRTGDGDNALVV
jgi:hypothetical protein